ncbi:MAG: AraC family transcriptional regulator [Thiobacillaceae bacterium]
MFKAGPNERIYPVAQLAKIVDLLVAEGISPSDALSGTHISKEALSSIATRVSLNQVIECFRNAARLTRNPRFAYQAGLGFHVSTFGMYGFAILCSMNFHQTISFAVKYHQLATPFTEISFKEEGGLGVWTFVPLPHPRVDALLYKFMVELPLGICMSLHRDVMGPSFMAKEIHVTYAPPDDAPMYPEAFGCEVLFGQSENKLVFDAQWLDRTPQLGNEINYLAVLKLCDELMEEMQLSIGLAGKVRELLLINLMRPTSFDAIARHLNMTTRTLRRKLQEENTSFRQLVDELRMQVAIKYLRDTDLTIEDIAYALGFSDAANFRHAFRRWTKAGPIEYRDFLRA